MSSTETISCFGVSYNHKEIQIDFLMNENWEMYSKGYDSNYFTISNF